MSTNMHSPHFLYPNSSTNRLSLTILSPSSRNSIITCARTNHKGFFPSKQSKKTLIQLARFTASHFHHVFPPPFNSVIQQFSGDGHGGGGGYGGSWWGGFDGGGGRKKRVNKKFKFWVLVLGFLVVCWVGFCGSGLSWRVEVKNDVVLGGMCLLMFLILVKNGLVAEWVLGFCGGGVVVGVLGDKRGELNKVVGGLGKMMGGSRRRRWRRRSV